MIEITSPRICEYTTSYEARVLLHFDIRYTAKFRETLIQHKIKRTDGKSNRTEANMNSERKELS